MDFMGSMDRIPTTNFVNNFLQVRWLQCTLHADVSALVRASVCCAYASA